MYQQYIGANSELAQGVRRDNLFIPFDPANTDYQKFKVDVAHGVELQDPDGNVMTQEQVQEILSTLP